MRAGGLLAAALLLLSTFTIQMYGRAHSPPDVKWLLEPMDIYNVNAPPTSRYKF